MPQPILCLRPPNKRAPNDNNHIAHPRRSEAHPFDSLCAAGVGWSGRSSLVGTPALVNPYPSRPQNGQRSAERACATTSGRKTNLLTMEESAAAGTMSCLTSAAATIDIDAVPSLARSEAGMPAPTGLRRNSGVENIADRAPHAKRLGICQCRAGCMRAFILSDLPNRIPTNLAPIGAPEPKQPSHE